MIDDEKSYVNQLKKYFSNLLYQILFLESELQNDNINDVSLKSTIKMIKNIVNYYLKKIDDLLQNDDKKYNFKIENIERDIIEMMFNNIDNIQDLLIKHSYEINKNSISNDIINIKLMLIFIKKKLKDIGVNKKYYIKDNINFKKNAFIDKKEENEHKNMFRPCNLENENNGCNKNNLTQSDNTVKDIVKKKNVKIINKSFLNIMIIVSLLGINVSIFNIFMHRYSSIKTNEITKNVSSYITVDNEEQENEYSDKIKRLKEINSDTIAWLKVKGTTIEYPVVKSSDNEFYLSHSFDKSYNKAGWIFADFRNSFDDNDDNLIIYGHNMMDGSMFNSLKMVIKSEWYENEDNHLILLLTENKQNVYKVFSTYKISAQDYETITKYESKENFKTYLNFIKKKSIFNYNTDVNEEDQILTLSTCDDNSNYRIVLHAKKVV